MPPLPPVPNVAKITLNYDNAPAAGFLSRAANVLHLQYPPTFTPTIAQLVTMANVSMSWWTSHFPPSVSSSWRLTGATATWLDGSGAQGVSTNAASAGSGGAACLPPQCAVGISWLGYPAIRGGKPRTYLPGVPSTAVIANTSGLTSAYCTTLRAAAEAARLDMTTLTVSSNTPAMVVVSYYNRHINPTPPYLRPSPQVYALSGSHVHERIDSQRRRSGKESFFAVI